VNAKEKEGGKKPLGVEGGQWSLVEKGKRGERGWWKGKKKGRNLALIQGGEGKGNKLSGDNGIRI